MVGTMSNTKTLKEHIMKKGIIALALIAGMAVTTTSFAHWGNNMGNGGYGYGMQQYMMQQQDPEAREKIAQFLADNKELRKQMAVKQAEKRALLRASNPDPAAIAKVTGELFDLRDAMMTKAEAAGISDLMGPGLMRGAFKGGSRGYGMGPGMMRGQGGYLNCPMW